MILEIYGGTLIYTAIKDAIALASKLGETVTFKFNDIDIAVGPDSSADAIEKEFHDESDRRREEYVNSPEYKEHLRQSEEKERCQRLVLEGALLSAPGQPTMKDQIKWDKIVEVNSNPYGAATVHYASLWARLMEGRIKHGGTIEDSADEASHLADTDGITGFMYGCAVSMLSQCWIHGEQLRRWHNVETQIGNEGEKANEEGGVLNPALLNIGT